jgi:hypothetical protein
MMKGARQRSLTWFTASNRRVRGARAMMRRVSVLLVSVLE